jgi:hypothetical protein
VAGCCGTTGSVAWWGDAEVPLCNVLVHLLAETSRHAGHADVLREGLDGAVGTDAEAMAAEGHDAAFWAERRADRDRRTCGGRGPVIAAATFGERLGWLDAPPAT